MSYFMKEKREDIRKDLEGWVEGRKEGWKEGRGVGGRGDERIVTKEEIYAPE